ncbi:MAG: hypothetical protein ACP5UF_07955 [Hydrogenobaculum sp.]
MKIKKILVDSLQEAIELTKAMYGDKATIMSTKVVKNQEMVIFFYKQTRGYNRYSR